jgi:hypothetical protein
MRFVTHFFDQFCYSSGPAAHAARRWTAGPAMQARLRGPGGRMLRIWAVHRPGAYHGSGRPGA